MLPFVHSNSHSPPHTLRIFASPFMWIWTEFTDKHTLWSHSMTTLLAQGRIWNMYTDFKIIQNIQGDHSISEVDFKKSRRIWFFLKLLGMTGDSRSPLVIDKANAWRLPVCEWWGVTHVFITVHSTTMCNNNPEMLLLWNKIHNEYLDIFLMIKLDKIPVRNKLSKNEFSLIPFYDERNLTPSLNCDFCHLNLIFIINLLSEWSKKCLPPKLNE